MNQKQWADEQTAKLFGGKKELVKAGIEYTLSLLGNRKLLLDFIG